MRQTQSYRSVDAAKLFGEFREDEKPTESASAPPAIGAAASELIDRLAALTAAFDRETALAREGDFDGFRRLQGAKRRAIRAVEQMSQAPSAVLSEEDRAAVEGSLADFNAAVDRNMRVLNAAREALRSVRHYALKSIEQKEADGVYGKDGAVRGPSRISVNGLQVKL